jgi:hypothetical protein
MSNQETVHMMAASTQWEPARGDATEALGKYLVDETHELPDSATFDRVVVSSAAILRQGKPFAPADGTRTGLVVGYVQSGKTVSMTTVASLARDNGCRLVILLAGVTDNLLKQTARKRLRPYLLQRPDPRRSWRLHDTVESPSFEGLAPQFSGWVREWKSSEIPEDRKRPLFLTVMKNYVHLQNLRDLLRSVDMRQVPSLILDDEADQASLDTKASSRSNGNTDESSTTYQRIFEIRRALPNHTYLQYTATPQAPLLISLADMLSPDFPFVLEPGLGYTGGRAFFIERSELVHEIPSADLFDPASPPITPPDSLVRAMREFFVGAAVASIQHETKPRSMLIHPSQRKPDHEAFLGFVRRVKDNWVNELRLPTGDSVREACHEDFRSSYDALLTTAPNLPSFDEVLAELPYTISDTPIWRVNSEDGHEVDWEQSRSHILVGGDKLNRGFTVEGLTVTYMPRKPGGWNADTIQQRARFFGYKARYLGLCRVYLHPDVADAYREYVEHEEDVRTQLKLYEGRPLKAWKRGFLLDHRMRPSRTNVLSETVFKPKENGWFRQSYPHATPERVPSNRKRIEDLLVAHGQELAPHPDHASHRVARFPLRSLFESFIVDYECFANDAIHWTAIAIWTGELLRERPETFCEIVEINSGAPRRRSEDVATMGRINQLFEGRRSSGGPDSYQGDESFRDPAVLTLQLHRLNVFRNDELLMPDVPAIAMHLPDDFDPSDVQMQLKRGA